MAGLFTIRLTKNTDRMVALVDEMKEWKEDEPVEDKEKIVYYEEKVKNNMSQYCDWAGVPNQEDVCKFCLCKWEDADEVTKAKWINYVTRLLPAVRTNWRKGQTQAEHLVSEHCTVSD